MSQSRPLYFYVLAETFGFVFTLVPAFASWATGISFAWWSYANGCVWLAILAPFVVCFSLFLIQWCFHLGLPKLKAGVYRIGPNRMMLSWLARLSMGRAVNVAGLRYLTFSSYILRFFYFRSLGAKFSPRATVSLNVRPVDYPLISIGPDSTIGDQTEISCHTTSSRHLILGTVDIGPRVFVSAHCTLGPGTILKADSHIGFGNLLTQTTIEEGKKVNDFEYHQGPPHLRAPSAN